MKLENFERNDLYGVPEARRVLRRTGIPPPLGRPGRDTRPALSLQPRGLSPRLIVPAGSSSGQGWASGGPKDQLIPTAPYLGSGQSGQARSGEFADSGQSTRTGSGGRWRRTEARRERLTDPGNGHSACARRPREQFARAQSLGARRVSSERCARGSCV